VSTMNARFNRAVFYQVIAIYLALLAFAGIIKFGQWNQRRAEVSCHARHCACGMPQLVNGTECACVTAPPESP
jgi:hypothetical protein